MASIEKLTALLSQSPLFRDLDGPSISAVAGSMRPVNFDAGQSIFQRGDPGRELYLVLSGRVRLSILTMEGRELSFAHATQGQIFGELAALDGRERSADATAVTRVETMTLAQAVLRGLIETTPPLAKAVITFLCQRLRDTDQQLEAIALHSIEVRLARLFLSLIRLQKLSPGPDGRVLLKLGMSQSDLGLLIGASRPKVNGALTALEDTGAVDRVDDGLVCDIDQLQDVAGDG